MTVPAIRRSRFGSGTPARWSLTLLLAATAIGCTFTHVAVSSVTVSELQDRRMAGPVKLHLLDGSTVVYAGGVTVNRRAVAGDGRQYALDLVERVRTADVPLDSIAAAETYDSAVSAGSSALGTTVVVGGVLLAVGMALALLMVSAVLGGSGGGTL